MITLAVVDMKKDGHRLTPCAFHKQTFICRACSIKARVSCCYFVSIGIWISISEIQELVCNFPTKTSADQNSCQDMKSFQSILVIAVLCYTVNGSPIKQDNRQATAKVENNEKNIEQDTMDLKRLSTSSNNTITDELENGASSNLLSVLGDLDGVEEMDGVPRQLLQTEGSHLLSMGLLPGKRRFDDNTALASTGQTRGNRFVMPIQDSNKFTQPPAHHRLLSENSNLNNYINEALLDEPKLDFGRPKMMNNFQMQHMDMPAMAERRQLNIRPNKLNNHANKSNQKYNNLNPSRSFKPQESRKRMAKPEPELDQEPPEQQTVEKGKGADIFRDEAEEKGADKRIDEQVDYDDEEEADEAADQRAMKPSARVSASKALEQRFSGSTGKATNNPRPGTEDSIDQDEDGESTDLRAKKSQPSALKNGDNGGSNGIVLNEDSGNIDRDSVDQKSGALMSDDSDESLAASQLNKSATDLQTAAGHHHHGHSHGHYYQYAGSPKKKAWKFGFKRGNHKHTIAREEKGYKNKFHSSFKWHAKEKCKKHKKCESMGKMSWHYEHHDKKKHHHY